MTPPESTDATRMSPTVTKLDEIPTKNFTMLMFKNIKEGTDSGGKVSKSNHKSVD